MVDIKKRTMVTDPIADYLTRIRNAVRAGHRVVQIPSSKIKLSITHILYSQGFILNYKYEDDDKQGIIKIALKIDPRTRLNAIKDLQRVSRSGLRHYAGVDKLPRVLNNMGISIISTSQGVMTDKEARLRGIGGEVLCIVY